MQSRSRFPPWEFLHQIHSKIQNTITAQTPEHLKVMKIRVGRQLLPNAVRLIVGRGRANRQRRQVPCSQVAETARIRQRAMAQQLRQHSQSLVSAILVDG